MKHSLGIAAITLLCSAGICMSSAQALPAAASLGLGAKPIGDVLQAGWAGSKKKNQTGFGGLNTNPGKNKTGSSAASGSNSKKGKVGSTTGTAKTKQSDDGGSTSSTASGGKGSGGTAGGSAGKGGGKANDNVLWGDYQAGKGSTGSAGSSAGKGTSSGGVNDNVLWGDYTH
jgi:hypothetical protein